MKKTKEVIIDTALDLFNSEGLSNVTLRTIANKMNISQGNLNYHFKKREDIIETLYFQLVEVMNSRITQVQIEESETVLSSLMMNIHNTMAVFYEYRFFLLDFMQIMRENSKIKDHYVELTKEREKQFLAIFEQLIKFNLMRTEAVPNEFSYLFKRLTILGNFWISDAVIQNTKMSKKVVSTYSKMILQTLYPYLTSKGQKIFNSLNLDRSTE
nr:TetR/AcrR family transcriptional regulator [uncultured Carboxylicivirga sp.]